MRFSWKSGSTKSFEIEAKWSAKPNGNFSKNSHRFERFGTNSLSRAARAISAPSEQTLNGKLREVGELFDLEEYFTEVQKEKKIWKIEKK